MALAAFQDDATSHRAERAATAYRILIAVALAVGIALRLRVYLANRSLWVDEAYLALNIIERDFAGLMRPLADNQAAPLGFLFIERLLVVLFGPGELVLRAFPLVAAVAALLLFWRLASHVLEPAGVATAVAAFAVSEWLIYYAGEAKQYGVDAAVTVLVWMVFVRLEDGLREDRARAWAAAAAIGAVVLWLSHPAVFVVGGIGLRWLWKTLRTLRWRSLAVRAPAGVLCAASFALAYVVAIRPIAEGTSLHHMWRRAAAPAVPASSGDLMWYVDWAWTLATLPLGRSGSAKLVALVLVLGAVALWSRRRDQFWWAAGAAGLTWLASALGTYPLAVRLWMFLAPVAILLLGAATDEVWRRTRERFVVVAPALALVILAPPIVTAAGVALQPPGKEEIRPLLQHIRERHRAGDSVYLYHAAAAPARYYAALGLGFQGDVVLGTWRRERSAFERDVERLDGRGRVWVLFSHVRRRGGVTEETIILETLNRIGVRLEERRETGAAVYLYEL